MTTPGNERSGRVAAVCGSPARRGGLGKTPLPEALFTDLGVPGDVHYGPTRWSGSQKKTLPNERPITVLSTEAVRAACEGLGLAPLPAGAYGENLLVEGLGDLSDVRPGDLLRTREVTLEVTEQNQPCKNLCHYHPEMMKAMLGRRGLITRVRREGVVRPGEEVTLVRSARGGSAAPSTASAPRTP